MFVFLKSKPIKKGKMPSLFSNKYIQVFHITCFSLFTHQFTSIKNSWNQKYVTEINSKNSALTTGLIITSRKTTEVSFRVNTKRAVFLKKQFPLPPSVFQRTVSFSLNWNLFLNFWHQVNWINSFSMVSFSKSRVLDPVNDNKNVL